MKSYVWLQTADGSIEQVEEKIAMLSSVISEQAKSGKGSSKNDPISLPQCVTLDTLRLITDFYRFHRAPRSEKERISFDTEFIHMDTKRFCELASVAGSLCLKHLSEFTFHVLSSPDYLTKEEKLETLRYNDGDILTRLSNKLLAKKRKEQKESEKQKNVETEKESAKEPSIDELLKFIEEDSKQARPPKKKKKKPKKNYQLQDTCKSENHKKPDDDSDDELDPELDPAMMKKIDREVKAFEKSLNKPLPERLQKILSLGKER